MKYTQHVQRLTKRGETHESIWLELEPVSIESLCYLRFVKHLPCSIQMLSRGYVYVHLITPWLSK